MKLAIVGAGVVGLVTGVMARDAGHTVIMYEKTGPASGASGKALGVLVPSTLQRPIDDLQRQGIAAWPDLAALLERVTGAPRDTFWRPWPHPRRAGCQQVRLPFLFELLQQAFTAMGGEMDECDVLRSDLPLLSQSFDHVILAAGYGNATLTDIAFTLSAGQAIRVKPTIPLTELVLEDNLYICPDWDGTVRIGSTSWDTESEGVIEARPEVTAALLARAAKVAPQLEKAEIIAAWVGARPVSVPRLPLMTCVDGFTNIWAVAGLGKIGVGLSPVVGRCVLDLGHTPAPISTLV